MAESVCTCVRIAGDGVRKGEILLNTDRWITSVLAGVSPRTIKFINNIITCYAYTKQEKKEENSQNEKEGLKTK